MCPKGKIVVVKELDFEISNGHYMLVVTATDQCPIPGLRLTSSTMVRMPIRTCTNLITFTTNNPQKNNPLVTPTHIHSLK